VKRFLAAAVLALAAASPAWAGGPPGPVTVYLFTQDGCPPCAAFAPVFRAWQARHPEASFVVIDVRKPSSAYLCERYGVTKTPTVVVTDHEYRTKFLGTPNEADLAIAVGDPSMGSRTAVRSPGDRYDPYGTTDYAKFRAEIVLYKPSSDWPYRLAVGVPNPAAGTYETHCDLPVGNPQGITEGLYECFWSPTENRPVMRRVGQFDGQTAAPAFVPSCPTGRCPYAR
jgi:thiol-disulfide isomerase/thioredoxin